MNKNQLIVKYGANVKLYDLADPLDVHRMNMNILYCSKKNKEPTFKLIAPYGHQNIYKADLYYFEYENTPISQQILEEMGFENWSYCWYILLNQFKDFSVTVYFQRQEFECVKVRGTITNVKTANELQTLIELLK